MFSRCSWFFSLSLLLSFSFSLSLSWWLFLYALSINWMNTPFYCTVALRSAVGLNPVLLHLSLRWRQTTLHISAYGGNIPVHVNNRCTPPNSNIYVYFLGIDAHLGHGNQPIKLSFNSFISRDTLTNNNTPNSDERTLYFGGSLLWIFSSLVSFLQQTLIKSLRRRIALHSEP